MEGFFILAGLFVLFLFLGSVAGFFAFFKMGKLQRELDLFSAKIESLYHQVKEASGKDAFLNTEERSDISKADVKATSSILDDQTKSDVDSHNAEQLASDDQRQSPQKIGRAHV